MTKLLTGISMGVGIVVGIALTISAFLVLLGTAYLVIKHIVPWGISLSI